MSRETQPAEAKEPGTLRHQRTLTHAPERIFNAFADPAQLAKWWGPKDFANSFEIFEFHKGGEWQFVMHGPDGKNYPNRSVFRDIEPGKKIVIQHISPPYFTLTVSLTPDAAGTLVAWEQAFDDPQVADQLRPICEPSNEQNLDRLDDLLRGAAA